VVPKLIRAVTQIKVAIMSYYPQYFASVKKATSYNTEQHCGFRSSLPPEESHSTPSLGTTGLGIIYAALR